MSRFIIYSNILLVLCFQGFLGMATAETIKIGWSGPLTGNSAVLGIDSVQAAQIVIDQVNSAGGIAGRNLELLVEDDQYDTAKAVSAYSKLAASGAVAIIASTYGGVFATAERALKDDILVINPLDCNNDIANLSENTFCIATESESIGRIISQSISQGSHTPVAVIYDEKNPFMELVASVIKKDQGEQHSYVVGLDQTTADFKPILLQAKSKGARSLVFLGHDPMGKAMRDARALGIQSQFYTVGTITSPGFQKLAGNSANGSLVGYWEAPRSQQYQVFLQAFKAKAGRGPILELASIPTYDATSILVSAIESSIKASGKVDVSNLKKFLYGLKNYNGVSGEISMDADGAVRTIREAIYSFNDGNLAPTATVTNTRESSAG